MLKAMNAMARLSEAGEVMIPATVRAAHGWHAGTRLELIDGPDGVLLRSAVATSRQRLSFAEFRAAVPAHEGTALTIAEMDAAVARLAGQ
jgi:AbrB family looped-hinge helix DNA binding protein